jgi:hypothetical protein
MKSEDIAFAKAAREKPCGRSIRCLHQLIVGKRASGIAVNQRRPGGKSDRVFKNERGDGNIGNFNVRVRAFEDHFGVRSVWELKSFSDHCDFCVTSPERGANEIKTETCLG